MFPHFLFHFQRCHNFCVICTHIWRRRQPSLVVWWCGSTNGEVLLRGELGNGEEVRCEDFEFFFCCLVSVNLKSYVNKLLLNKYEFIRSFMFQNGRKSPRRAPNRWWDQYLLCVCDLSCAGAVQSSACFWNNVRSRNAELITDSNRAEKHSFPAFSS